MTDEFISKAKEIIETAVKNEVERMEKEYEMAKENPGDINYGMPDYFKELTGQLDTLGTMINDTLHKVTDEAIDNLKK